MNGSHGLPIRIAGLRKSFGRTVALDGLDLEIRAGEIHGFLGPNGSGKTTTIRVLLGLLRTNGGTVELLGGDPWHDAARLHRRLAYVPGDVSLWPELTGGEVIDLLGRLRGGFDPHRRDELLERFELDPTKKGRAYSKGNRQKVALVAALAADVELLLLDEPTAGLDPLMEHAFRDVLAEERGNGRTVLLSSHISALRLRTEETSLRAEAVLATDVGRLRWAAGHLLVAMAGTTCLALAAGLTAGGTYAWHTRHAGDVLSVLDGALVQLPAIWVVIGVVVAAFGVGPRAAGIGWVALVLFLLLGEFGPLFELPQRVMDVSPFAHVPQLPGESLHATPIVALLSVALVLTGAGLAGLRRRDIG